jgi:hypothetical protein
LKKARLSSKLALRLKGMLNVLEKGQHSQHTQGGTIVGRVLNFRAKTSALLPS